MYPRLYEQIYEEEKTYRNLNGFDKLIELPNYEDLHMFEDHNIDQNNVAHIKQHHKETDAMNNSEVVQIERPLFHLSEKYKNILKILNELLNLHPTKIFAAGGFVLNHYTNKDNTINQDVDLFICSETLEEFRQICLDIASFLDIKSSSIYGATNICSHKMVENCLIFFLPYGIEFQIILRKYTSPSQIIHGFDVDCCCILYTAEGKYYATKRGYYAIKNKINIFNFDRLSPSYEYRLIKYYERGYNMYIPQFDRLLKVIQGTWFDKLFFKIRKCSYVLIEYFIKGHKTYTSDYISFLDGTLCNLFGGENLEEKLKNCSIKVVDPGEQSIGTFHRTVLEDINNWYPVEMEPVIVPMFSDQIIEVNRSIFYNQEPLFGSNINRQAVKRTCYFNSNLCQLLFDNIEYNFCIAHSSVISYATGKYIKSGIELYLFEEEKLNDFIVMIIKLFSNFFGMNVDPGEIMTYVNYTTVDFRTRHIKKRIPSLKIYTGMTSYVDILNNTRIDSERFIAFKDDRILTDERGIYAWKNKVQINEHITFSERHLLEKRGFGIVTF